MRFPTAVRASLTVMFMLPAATFAQVSSPHAKVPQESRRERAQIQPETYGTSSLTYVSLSPFDFHPRDSATAYTYAITPVGIYPTAGQILEAPVRLPEGALVSYLEMYSCGTPTAGALDTFFAFAKTDGTWSNVGGPSSPANGCSVTSVSITPIVVDNSTTSYTVTALFALPTGSGTRLGGYRIGYKLQISPDPATATFADVPVGHPFHRFVEALYASGITGGCGGGNYCPDAPVTRGQMAVFLAGALGLHWAP
jgi:hypothetical protein